MPVDSIQEGKWPMDVEKALACARKLGPNTPLQLRWEGSGDSIHAYNLLKALQSEHYSGADSHIAIRYNAFVNIYESFENANAQNAWQYMVSIHAELELFNHAATGQICDRFFNRAAEQSCILTYNADVTRASNALMQSPAHIMFVRNLMLTDDTFEESKTAAKDDLLNLHTAAVRQRARSLVGGGELRLGMSGAPGLKKELPGERTGKGPATISEAFYGFDALKTAATDAGLKMITNSSSGKRGELLLGQDKMVGPVMLNRGKHENKTTHYLTFQAPSNL